MLPCRVIALNLHRTAAAAAVGMLVLAGACASPLKPVVAPASPMSATPAPVPSAVPAPQATTSLPKPTTRPAAARCPTTLASELARTAGAAQLITVTAPAPGATSASISLWQRSGGCWSLVAGPWPARVGGTGVSDHHREGDGSTPAGLYGIGPVMYGLAADPGVRYAYHRLACGDWWDEDPASPTYNTFQHVACNATPPFKGKSEALWQATT
ncbi:MAG: putative secreted protein, partial [Actinobacteria bacterium]|nr:putative secreted protein [Actinomycetota bacterium]